MLCDLQNESPLLKSSIRRAGPVQENSEAVQRSTVMSKAENYFTQAHFQSLLKLKACNSVIPRIVFNDLCRARNQIAAVLISVIWRTLVTA